MAASRMPGFTVNAGSSSMKKKSVEAPEKNIGAVQKKQTGGIDLGPSKMPGSSISKAPMGMPRIPLAPGKGMAPIFKPSVPNPPVMDRMPGPMVNNVPPMIPAPPIMDNGGMTMPVPNQMDMTMNGGMNRLPMNNPGIMAPGIPQDGLWGKYNALGAPPNSPISRQGGMFGSSMRRRMFQ